MRAGTKGLIGCCNRVCTARSPPAAAAPPWSRSTLAGLPRLRLLSLTLTGALPIDGHRQLARLAALEELHLYLQPSTPTPCDFQPGALGG